jgi:hypothetical protein
VLANADFDVQMTIIDGKIKYDHNAIERRII